MKWLVYLHFRLDTGECFYIGKGTEKRARAKDGRNPWARANNLHSAAIHRCLTGKQKEHKGYTFKYKELI
jgi:hypothetical protein